MKKLFSLFVVAFMAMSMMAVDWSGIGWVGNGAGGDYTNKYKFYTSVANLSMVNIQHPGFATADGFYITFPDAAFNAVEANGAALTFDQQGAGIVLHMTNFTAQETEVLVKNNGETRWTFYIYYEDGTAAGGEGGGEEPGEDPVEGTRTVYFYNSSAWTAVNAYCWNADGNNTWPGVAMTAVEGASGWYSLEISDAYTSIIFDNGNSGDGNQTADATIPADDNVYYDGGFVRLLGLGDWDHTYAVAGLNGHVFTYEVQNVNALQTSSPFKFKVGDAWYGYSTRVTKATQDWITSSTEGSNILFDAQYFGTYTITFAADTKSFKVTYPTVQNYTLKNGTHTITLLPEYYGKGDYKLTITSEETLQGLGGSYWNVSGVGTEMRKAENYTKVDDHTLVCSVTSNAAPNIYTPLYVMMPGEVIFGYVTLEWLDKGPAATASSGTAALAIDGNLNTRWESSFTDDEWWMVDYKAPKQINTIKIVWEGAYGKSFNILGSNNGTDWTNVTTVTDQTLSGFPYTQEIVLSEAVTYQYLKFEGVARGTGYGYSFWEFDAFYREVDVLTTFKFGTTPRFAIVGEEVNLGLQALNQYDEAMEVEVEYTVAPATAGHVTDGKYIADQLVDATVTATSGTKTATATIYGVESANLAFNKNANAGHNPAGAGASNNGNTGDRWGSNGATHPDDDWWYVDLGAKYDISLLAIKWENACPTNYDIKISDDGENWTVAKTYTEAPIHGGDNGDFHPYADLGDVQARYIGVWANAATFNFAYGISIYEFNVYGTEVVTPADPIYFINTGEWENVYCYVRNVEEDPTPSAVGVLATKIERQINGYDVYSFAPAADDLVCRFTDGTTVNKSNDQDIQLGRYYTYTASWSAEQVEEVMVSTYLLGTINGEEGFTVKADYKLDETLTKSYNLKAGTYKLKVLDHGEWYGYNGTVTPEARAVSSTAEFSKSVGEDCTLTLTDLTKVDFTWDAATSEMSFEFANVDPTTLNFTIVGDEELIGEGHDWDLDYAAYNMTQDAENSNIFTLSVSNVYLRVGNYEYKAAAEHSWDYYLAPATGNNTLEINDNGLFDIVYTLSFETGNPVLTAVATFKEYATGCDEVDATKAQKIVRDRKIVIIKNGVEYSVLGARL